MLNLIKKLDICRKYFVHYWRYKNIIISLEKSVHNLKSFKMLKNILRTLVCFQPFIVASKYCFEKKVLHGDISSYSPRTHGDVSAPFGTKSLTQILKSLLRENQFFLCH